MEILLNLLKVSIIVGCVVLLLILLKPALNRRYHAKWKYYTWLVLALVLLVPLVPKSTAWFGAVGETAPIQIQVPPVELPFDRQPALDSVPVTTIPDPVPVTGEEQELPQVESTPLQSPVEPAVTGEMAVKWLWLVGTVTFALYHLVGTAVFYRRCLRWRCPVERAYVREGVARVVEELGIKREIPVWVTSTVDTPMMIGLIRPQLLLPGENYREQELYFILKHELTHYKRRDLWYKLALLTANAVHWFNPLAYLLVREANADMELTCDDAVVAGADVEMRRAYSETLLAAIHRQKGLQGAALSTHFYGGAEVMKERFRNILGNGRRKRGIVVLCVVLLLTIIAGCAIAFTVQKTEKETLDDQELAEWEEKLASPEWNGFVTRMYSNVKYLSLNELLYDGAGISHEMTDGEVEAYLDATDMLGVFTDMEAITAEALEDYLKEHTGLTVGDFAAMFDWVYVEEYDTYYFQHGDTNYTGVEVVSGTRTGNTVTLEIWAPGSWDAGMTAGTGVNWENGILTITDGKVVSYCNDLYAAVETMALSALQELEDSCQENMPISRGWVELLGVWGAFAGEQGDYYEWEGRMRLVPVDPEALDDLAWAEAVDGELPYSCQLIVRQKPDGTVEHLESGYGVEGTTEVQFRYLGVSFSEYARYHYDYGLELQGRQMGWPNADNRLVVSIQNGGDAWTQTAEDVAKGWLMSWGDDLDHYEVVYAGTPEGELADQDQVLRVWSTGGRCVLLALDHVLREYGVGDWADTVTYWEVMGYNLESGNPLPQERVGQDSRSDTITLDRTLGGEEERVPCFLYSGGGDYGLYTWSLYVPYEQWSCNYLANRWCPNPNDMSTYMEVRQLDASYTAETFFDSYVQQFEEVWTNQAVYGTGSPDTVTVAWARGYQSENGGRYTESYLFTSGEQVYEVLWTYTAEDAEDWGARMRWSADTFSIIGSTGPAGTGELKQVKPGEATEGNWDPLLVTEENGDMAGTYLVLGEDNAFQLESYVRSDLQYDLDHEYPKAFDKVQIVSISWEATYSGAEIFSNGSQDTVEVFWVDWGAQLLDESRFQPAGGMRDDGNGFWRFGMRDYLILVHNGEYVTKTALLRTEIRPDDPGFISDVQTTMATGGAVTNWSSHWAIFYDRTEEKLYVIASHPAIISNE